MTNIFQPYPVLLYLLVSCALLSLGFPFDSVPACPLVLFVVIVAALAVSCVRILVLFEPALHALQVFPLRLGMLIMVLAGLAIFHPLLLAAQDFLTFRLCRFSRSSSLCVGLLCGP